MVQIHRYSELCTKHPDISCSSLSIVSLSIPSPTTPVQNTSKCSSQSLNSSSPWPPSPRRPWQRPLPPKAQQTWQTEPWTYAKTSATLPRSVAERTATPGHVSSTRSKDCITAARLTREKIGRVLAFAAGTFGERKTMRGERLSASRLFSPYRMDISRTIQ